MMLDLQKDITTNEASAQPCARRWVGIHLYLDRQHRVPV